MTKRADLILSNYRSGTHHLHALIAANGLRGLDEFILSLTLRHDLTANPDDIEYKTEALPELDLDYMGSFHTHMLSALALSVDGNDSAMAEAIAYSIVDSLAAPLSKKTETSGGLKTRVQQWTSINWSDDSVGILQRPHTALLYDTASLPFDMPSVDYEVAALAFLFPNTRFIHLSRDPVDCAVSFYLAEHYGAFFSFALKKDVPKASYNFDKILRMYDFYIDKWHWPRPLLAKLNAVEVKYDELCEDPVSVMYGLDYSVAKQSKFAKQADPLKGEFAERFRHDIKKVKNYVLPL